MEDAYINFDWLTAPQLDDFVSSLGVLLDDLLSHQPAQGRSEAAQARYRRWTLENPEILEQIAVVGNIRSTAKRWQKSRHDLARADWKKARDKEWRRFNAQGGLRMVLISILLEKNLKVVFLQGEPGWAVEKVWDGGSSLRDTWHPRYD
ncbi:uncharacterized protein H6S33_011018 [Morchella sextelata]|uniref:uncharacterized protein n=1 Tax=Morchella sextelata TaxID=1174677 RepID=UPI001D03BB46|nr:uncharacterized protein H6S33_011018 [Morchella sextelata]KAH0611753.1 hypothetical protein H6S33_011018 [Morchella sextelata]